MKRFRIRPKPDETGRGAGAREDRPPRVFVTGATGYLGRAVVAELVAAGYDVAGLTRWAERTLELRALGARSVVGDLQDPLSYRRVARGYDVLVHLAAEKGRSRAAADASAVECLLWAARPEEPRAGEPPRLVVYTSGCFVLGPTGEAGADESASTDRAPEIVAWRPAHERRILDAADEHVTTAVIRPGIVYGGTGGLIGRFFATAERDGAAAFVGDGRNRWTPVHVGDVARLYRLVVERRAGGVFHCAEAEAVPVAELARAASEAAGRGGAVRGVPLQEARRSMGAEADALVMDQLVLAPRARELGWRPEHAPFLECAGDVHREWCAGQRPVNPAMEGTGGAAARRADAND